MKTFPLSPFAASASQAADAASLGRALTSKLEEAVAAAGRAAARADELNAQLNAKDAALAAQALKHDKKMADQGAQHKAEVERLRAAAAKLVARAVAAEEALEELRANLSFLKTFLK